jgi:hypothetical protein
MMFAYLCLFAVLVAMLTTSTYVGFAPVYTLPHSLTPGPML